MRPEGTGIIFNLILLGSIGGIIRKPGLTNTGFTTCASDEAPAILGIRTVLKLELAISKLRKWY